MVMSAETTVIVLEGSVVARVCQLSFDITEARKGFLEEDPK